jgi:competence protein ComFC
MGKVSHTLHLIQRAILDFLFPRNILVRQLETMSPSQLLNAARPADPEKSTFSIFTYKDPLIATALWEVKYRKNVKIARLLASVLHDRLIHELSEQQLFDNFTKPYLIPIPASRERMRKFGYNQCELLAKLLCEIDGGTNFTFADPLDKFKETPSQTRQKDRVGRQENVKNAFEVKARDLVQDRNIILLDDVTTTGSTLREATRVLMINGAKKVLAITVAH